MLPFQCCTTFFFHRFRPVQHGSQLRVDIKSTIPCRSCSCSSRTQYLLFDRFSLSQNPLDFVCTPSASPTLLYLTLSAQPRITGSGSAYWVRSFGRSLFVRLMHSSNSTVNRDSLRSWSVHLCRCCFCFRQRHCQSMYALDNRHQNDVLFLLSLLIHYASYYLRDDAPTALKRRFEHANSQQGTRIPQL